MALTDLCEGALVEVERVATGTVWFIKPVNPYRVSLGLIRDDGREWVGDLNPHTVEVADNGTRVVITHTDPEETS
jgi:hypothetical protein